MSKNKKTRHGSPALMARLDFHGWDGRLVNRIKAKTTEKSKGIMMVENIEDKFNITRDDIEKYREESMNEMREEMLKPRVFENLSKDRIENLHKPLRKWSHKKI